MGFIVSRMSNRDDKQEQNIVQELLKSLRQKAGMRQIDVANALGIPQSMVSKYEVGERRLDILEVRIICNLFGISLPEFVQLLEGELNKNNEAH